MVPAPNVPAWRRIGLKLKHETAEPAEPSATSPPLHHDADGSGNKRSFEESGLDNPGQHSAQVQDGEYWKRRKLEEKRKLEESVNFIPLPNSRATSQPEQKEVSHSTLQPRSKKRKSVSFAPDLKGTEAEETLDGSKTVSNPEQDPKRRFTDYRKASNGTTEPTPSAEGAKPKKKKKAKNPPKKPTVDDWSPRYLSYLSDFYRSRDTWKFSKSKQTHLLRHIFDVKRVPSEYSAELNAYLAGLKGASIREKLRVEALKIRELDEKALGQTTMDEASKKDKKEETAEAISRGNGVYGLFNPGTYAGPSADERKAEYKEALRRFKREEKDKLLKHEEWAILKDPLWRPRIDTRLRAEEALLWCGGESNGLSAHGDRMFVPYREDAHKIQKIRPGVIERGRPVTNGTNGAAPNGDVPKPKRKRKRKRRTGVPDDDTSSDETSTSEEDGDEEPEERKASKRRRPDSPVSVSSLNAVEKKHRSGSVVSVESFTPGPKQAKVGSESVASLGSTTRTSTGKAASSSSESSSNSTSESDSSSDSGSAAARSASGTSTSNGSEDSESEDSSEGSESGSSSGSGSGSATSSGTSSGSGTDESESE